MDVIFLNVDSLLLKYQIIKEGIVIKDHDERAEFESLTLREYFDFKYYSDYYDECFLNYVRNKEKRSIVKREVVLEEKLNKFYMYVEVLNKVKGHSKEEYLEDPFIYGAAERFLHLSIECVLDISNHVISDMRYRKPENNRDIFEILSENKIIEESLKNNLCNMAGFRNVLVHDYIKLNRSLVYEIILNNLKDIEKFMKIVSEYV